jgi:hypothetical protein
VPEGKMPDSGVPHQAGFVPAQENVMTLCPVAIAVGCRKCPIFAVCPLKSQIGDYEPEPEPKEKERKK